jgi:hypothetical protein
MMFKSVILFMWLLAMLVEFREITMIGTLVMNYPDAEQFGDDAVIEEVDPADPEDVRYRIQGITSGHRTGMRFLILLRAFMTAVLTWVGTTFLLKQVDYIDLMLDGVALIFIVEVASLLYEQVLRDEVRDQTEDIFPMKVVMYGIEWLNRRPALVDIICVFALVAGTYGIMMNHRKTIVDPVYEALDCTCRTRGDKCMEAQKFDYDFWYDYWKNVVPGVFTEVAKLKAGGASAAAGAASYFFGMNGPEKVDPVNYGVHQAKRMLNKKRVVKDEPSISSSSHLHHKSLHHTRHQEQHQHKHGKTHHRRHHQDHLKHQTMLC